MLTLVQFYEQAALTHELWPYLEKQSTPVKRMVLARLAALWIEQEPQRLRKEYLDSLILSIELRLAGKMGKE